MVQRKRKERRKKRERKPDTQSLKIDIQRRAVL